MIDNQMMIKVLNPFELYLHQYLLMENYELFYDKNLNLKMYQDLHYPYHQ
jgi:hypothetical protein